MVENIFPACFNIALVLSPIQPNWNALENGSTSILMLDEDHLDGVQILQAIQNDMYQIAKPKPCSSVLQPKIIIRYLNYSSHISPILKKRSHTYLREHVLT